MNEYEKILDKLAKEKFIVYGTGGHADKFVKAIRRKGIHSNILGFAVSSNNQLNDNCECIEDINKERLIVIAAHDKNSREMEQNLIRLGFKNYVLVYPYMTEICFGSPYETDVMLDIDEFMKECSYGNYLAIYYLAVECADGKNDFGDKLYLKVMKLSSEEETANRRWDSMISRTQSYRKNCKAEDFPIKVNIRQKYILDGFHRMALAKYFGIKKLKSDLFDTDLNYYNSMTFRSMWADDDLNSYFLEKEKEQIIRVRKEIFGQVK